MSKHFRPWNIDQTLLLPPNVRDFVPKDHVSRFIVGLVRDSLDLKAIMGSYVSGLGQPPFDPRMMVSLLLHGYASGLYSSRRIARACCERNDFVMIPWLYGSWQMVGPAIWRSRTRRANQALRRALDVQSLLDPHGRRSL